MEYIRNPKSVRSLSKELKKVCDDYWTGKINEQVLKEYIHHVAKNNKLLENNGKDINRSIKTIIGKRRLDLVKTMLVNFQITLN